MYLADQTVVGFSTKVFPVAHWPGLITTVGNGAMVPLFGWSLARRFSTFDELIAGASAVLPDLVKSYELPSGGDIFFVGISDERGPEAYVASTDGVAPPLATREELEASEFYGNELFTLVKLPDLVMTPVPSDQVVPANYEGIDVDADTETVIWSLRLILEMQRQTKLYPGVGGIGGFGQVTTISGDGITQRMLQRWPADKLGAPLRPGPIDWVEWHAANPKPTSADVIPYERMSRVRRDMLDRKARKLRLS
jgi:hypothetical protein